jgi:hypothetical protein
MRWRRRGIKGSKGFRRKSISNPRTISNQRFTDSFSVRQPKLSLQCGAQPNRPGDIITMMQAAFIVGALLLPVVALAQGDVSSQTEVLTVCEVLGNQNQHHDSVVAVVGRLYRSVSLIDGSDFLTQDQCRKPIVTKGFEWPNTILIWSHYEDGVPKPPNDEPNLDKELVAKQLAVVRETTKLGFHKVPRIRVKDGSTTYSEAEVPNQWVIVYGRIFGSPNLSQEPCNNDELGCRGFMGAPVALFVKRKNILVLNEDGTLHRASERNDK